MALNDEYERIAKENKQGAEVFLVQHPIVEPYRKWLKSKRNAFNNLPENKYAEDVMPSMWAMWAQLFDDPTKRLIVQYFSSGKMSPALRSSLTRVWMTAGSPEGNFDVWLQKLKATYTP
jgi:hypothetical protein